MLSYARTLRAHAAGEPVSDALRLDYADATDAQLTTAYTTVAKAIAVAEEYGRTHTVTVQREHLNIIVAEQQKRGGVAV